MSSSLILRSCFLMFLFPFIPREQYHYVLLLNCGENDYKELAFKKSQPLENVL